MTLLRDLSLIERLMLPDDDPKRIRVGAEPFRFVRQSSVDVHLGPHLYLFTGDVMDARRDQACLWRPVQTHLSVNEDTGRPEHIWYLERDRMYLGALLENIYVPVDLNGRLAGVSTRARQGFVIHQQAGKLEAGWEGHATVELTAVAASKSIIRPGERIGQVEFEMLDGPVGTPYWASGRYQHDRLPQPARPDLTTAYTTRQTYEIVNAPPAIIR